MEKNSKLNYYELPKKTIPLFKQRWTPIFLEHGKIHVEGSGVRWIDKDGCKIVLPVASISCLLVGPGTSITHEAIRVCANSNTLIAWVGREGFKFYSMGVVNTERSKNIEKQAKFFSSPKKKKKICQDMFQYRFEEVLEGKTINQIRGEEGKRIKKIYLKYRVLYGVPWQGRKYDKKNIFACDNINYALNISNYALYAYCLSCILCMGFSPSLGFIHSGHSLSFVFDIADLFKVETSIKSSFYTVGSFQKRPTIDTLLSNLKMFIESENLSKKMPEFLGSIFD